MKFFRHIKKPLKFLIYLYRVHMKGCMCMKFNDILSEGFLYIHHTNMSKNEIFSKNKIVLKERYAQCLQD